MPKRIKSRKKSKRKIKSRKKKNKGHLLSVVHGSWLKIPVACRFMLTQSDHPLVSDMRSTKSYINLAPKLKTLEHRSSNREPRIQLQLQN